MSDTKKLFRGSGRDTGIFSRLGLALCSTVYSRTSDNKRLLVSILSYFLLSIQMLV